jgi:hypothetical protein
MIQSYRLPMEIDLSIRNVLNGNFSTSEIAKFCDVSTTTINDLKKRKRDIDSSSLELCMNLYQFAMQHGVNDDAIRAEEMKGRNSFIEPSFEVSKLYVAFDELDLIPYGAMNIYERQYDFPRNHDQMDKLYLSDAVFITPNKKKLNARDLGYSFKCRYGGTGPNNLVDFLKNYSRISVDELKEVIFNSDVIEYDFKKDRIRGLPKRFREGSISLYSLKGKLEFFLEKFDNNPFFKKAEDSSIEQAAVNILEIAEMLHEQYALSPLLKFVHYYPMHDTYNEYTRETFTFHQSDIHIVFEFQEYEICLPYRIDQNKGDIFKSEEMQILLNGLGIEYKPENTGVFWGTIDSLKKIDGKQSLEVGLTITG